jgi:hypothetical protein
VPDIFRTVIACSVLFILFTTVVSALAATKEQSHFKTSLVIRLLLFIMNVVPIALFQHVLLPKFGFRIFDFVLVYIIVQIGIDALKPVISNLTKNIKIPIIISKIVYEVIAVGISFLIVTIPIFSASANMRDLDMENMTDLFTYFLYIILFNAITFFTVEYCINIFREEYKKNYTKYYFLFTYNVIKRISFTLKNAMPQVLEKIKKNLSWLVMFIIAVDSIFENVSSVGSNLLNGYIDPDGAIIMIRSIFYLLLVMFLLNTCFDVFIKYLYKNEKHEEDDAAERQVRGTIARKPNTKLFLKAAAAAGIAVVYIVLFIFNQREYAFAGYYDFSENQHRTFGMFLDYFKIDEDGCSPDLIYQYKDAALCRQEGDPPYFYIMELGIENENGEIKTLVPFYDKKERRYFFIQGNTNQQRLFDISYTDKIVSVKNIKKYQKIAFTREMTKFSLPADKASATTISKPLYLVSPYYIQYFMTLLIVVVAVVYSIYTGISKYYFMTRRKSDRKLLILVKIFNEILFFLNTINIVVIFLLINLLFRRLQSNNTLTWENQTFIVNIFSYCIIQILIAFMFSDSYITEISLYLKRMLKTKEFYYYSLIGMWSERQYRIFHLKYGKNLLLKLIFQNILFVLNINWFIVYAFNTWRKFTDTIGITYAISFENIFTKIIRYESVRTGIYNFIILIVFDTILFLGYYYSQKRLVKG